MILALSGLASRAGLGPGFDSTSPQRNSNVDSQTDASTDASVKTATAIIIVYDVF